MYVCMYVYVLLLGEEDAAAKDAPDAADEEDKEVRLPLGSVSGRP
jgi:hypothetical protein